MNTLPELRDLHRSQQNKQKSYRTMIANLDTENLPGSHWVGIYEKDDKIEIFDSFGEPLPPLLQAWAARNSKSYIFKDYVINIHWQLLVVIMH